MSISYFAASGIALLYSTAATIAAAGGHAPAGAVLAGMATLLFGLEKALLLREKWAHHLAIAGRLDTVGLPTAPAERPESPR
jgi:hypothetical protein